MAAIKLLLLPAGLGWLLVCVLGLGVSLGLSPSQAQADNQTASRYQWYQQDWAIMGTTVGARIWWSDPEQATQLLALVRQEMQRIDATYSPYKATSELSQVNQRAARQAQTLSVEFSHLMDKAQWVNRISQGAFDISYASVGQLYDYRAGTAPNAQQINQHLPAVSHFEWQPKSQKVKFNHPSVKLDLGGLAKGYAVEQASAILRRHGVRHASINAGGDTRLLGDNLGKPWLIGVKNPRPANADQQWQSVIKLPLIDEAISTSGDNAILLSRTAVSAYTTLSTPKLANPAMGWSVPPS